MQKTSTASLATVDARRDAIAHLAGNADLACRVFLLLLRVSGKRMHVSTSMPPLGFSVCLVVGMSSINLVSAATIDTALAEELRNNAIPQWIEWEARLTNFETRLTWKYDVPSAGKASTREQVLAVTQDGKMLIETLSNGFRSRRIRNGKYEFEVGGLGTSAGAQLESGELVTGNAVTETYRRQILSMRESGGAWSAGLLPARCLFDPEYATLTSVEISPDQPDGARWTRVSGVIVKSIPPVDKYTGMALWMDVAADQDFRVVACGLFPGEPDRQVKTVREFRETAEFGPVVSRMVMTTYDAGVAIDATEKTFEAPTRCQIAESEFWLPHYGIPESALQTLRPNVLWRYVVIVANVIALVIVFILLRRNRSRPQNATTQRSESEPSGST